jgi:hypothetical protein
MASFALILALGPLWMPPRLPSFPLPAAGTKGTLPRSPPAVCGGWAVRRIVSKSTPHVMGAAPRWEHPEHLVSRKHGILRRPVGWGSDMNGTPSGAGRAVGECSGAQELLQSCLKERGLELVPCGQDCVGAIVRCVHAARIPELGLDAPDEERSLRRLWADVLLYTSPSHVSTSSATASLLPSTSAVGAWPDDETLDACAQVCELCSCVLVCVIGVCVCV